jgi:hypothetical protein
VEIHKPEQPPDVYGQLSSFDQNKPQVFTLKSCEETTVKGRDGTEITFRPDIFEYESGAPLPCKIITIELREFYSLYDILMAELTTTSNSRLLESAGMIHITARHGEKELRLKKGETIEIRFPGGEKNFSGMKLFEGEMKDNLVNWHPAPEDTSATKQPAKPDSVIMDTVYTEDTATGDLIKKVVPVVLDGVYTAEHTMDRSLFKSAKLGWLNCDRFVNVASKGVLVVTTDTSYRATVRIIFREMKSVMPAYPDATGKSVFREIPVGEKITLLAYSIRNKKVYAGTKDLDVRKNASEEIGMEETTLEELGQLVRSFE